MAGGRGTRLWPKSRIKKPKQLYNLIGKESMLKNTVQRLLPSIPKEKIFIATNKEQVKEIKKELSEIKNIISEPYIRNTGPCIGLSCLFMENQEEPTAFLPSDHYIEDEREFRRVLKLAEKVAKKDYLVTIGIRPTDPDTGLGYIKIGRTLDDEVFEVEKFIEKPDLERAKKFLKRGNYLWNAGMFIGKPRVILDLFKELAPRIYQRLENIRQNPQKLDSQYEKMENISFDYAIAEKARKTALIPGDFGWSDIGNWARLLDILSQKLGENVVVGCDHIGVETKGCLIHGTERLVATIGLKDIIVVDTPDVLLVCHKKDAQKVKEIVERLKKEKKDHYL